MRQLVTTAILMNCAATLAIACGGTDSNTSTQSGNTGGDVSGTTGVGGNAQPNGGNSSPTGGAANAGGSQNLGGASSGGTRSVGGGGNTGTPITGGAPSGGAPASGGVSSMIGGAASTGGSAATGGSRATGGTNASTSSSVGGTKATGGASASTGGTKATGGASAGTGGTKATGGASATGGAGAGGSSGTCGTLNPNPFGCKFAWGLSDYGGSLAGYSYLQFMTTWIETAMNADGTFNSCGGCNWIKNSIAPTNLIPVYYAYIIGFLGHANGYVDGNQCPASNPNCPNLTNNGADLIRSKRSQIVSAYANYAKQSYAVWPTKPLVWLLEGDFVQYAGSSQSNPLTMTELGQLAADITCAIKGNMPNAVVAIDHSTWNPDQTTKDFFNAMKTVNYDMVWTTGVANNNGYIYSGANASSYNSATAKYSVLRQLTGKTMLVDDGCGAELNEDWKTATPSLLNGLIANGVIAFTHCGHLESTYQSSITALEPQLNSTCL